MSHAREQIRVALRAVLDNLPSIGRSAVEGRVYAQSMLPALAFDLLPEVVNLDEGSAGYPDRVTQERELVVTIEARVAASGATYLATLDAIAADVEVAMAQTPDLGIGVAGVHLIETEQESDDEHEQPAALLTLRYRLRYRTEAHDPTVIIQ